MTSWEIGKPGACWGFPEVLAVARSGTAVVKISVEVAYMARNWTNNSYCSIRNCDTTLAADTKVNLVKVVNLCGLSFDTHLFSVPSNFDICNFHGVQVCQNQKVGMTMHKPRYMVLLSLLSLA